MVATQNPHLALSLLSIINAAVTRIKFLMKTYVADKPTNLYGTCFHI